MATSGKTLRLERVRADLTATALARQMGLSRQTLWATERAAAVDPDRVIQYRAAIKTLRDASENAA